MLLCEIEIAFEAGLGYSFTSELVKFSSKVSSSLGDINEMILADPPD